MKNKRIYIIFGILITVLLFTACKKVNDDKHVHSWIDATCTEAKHCSTCNEIEGKALGHNNSIATCEEPSVCTICGEFNSMPLGHSWVDATLFEAKHCSLCGLNEGVSLLQKEINTLVPTSVSSKVNLPSTLVGVNVTWKSLDIDVMLDDGTIVASDTSKKVLMEYSFEYEDNVIKDTVEITVNPASISTGVYDIAYKYYVTKLDSKVGKNISLIKRDYNGCSVKYISLNEDIITSDGKINQKSFDQTTTIKMYVIKDGIAVLYNNEITVVGFSESQRLSFAVDILKNEIQKFIDGEISVLPTYEPTYDVEIYWNTNVAEFLVLDNMVLTPFEKTDVKLDCILRCGTTINMLNYDLKDVGGNLTEEEYIAELVKYMIKVNLKGSINHLHPEYNDELFLDYQERTNSYGVLNLANGKNPLINKDYYVDETSEDLLNTNIGGKLGIYKPAVPQSTLDEVMYEGYQMPNDSNVLWITVHESAMTTNGHNAEFLASMQYKNAFVSTSYREASWHYQVDAYSIYHSYADNTVGWHAGDGSATAGNGNNNGIGIEMCVNSDGNYEGTLVNNAKLVASLLLKYNLGLANVKRHYDHSGKECPSYLIRTARWQEFMTFVQKEYLIMKYLGDATVEYNLSTANISSTEEVLSTLFIKGDNGLYYNKPVSETINVNIDVKVVKNSKTYTASSVFCLKPNGEK